eukprot:UN04673
MNYGEISTLIVHIIRSYLKDNHFTQAYQFLSSITFPGADKVDPKILSYFIYYKALIFAVYEEYAKSLDELLTVMRISNEHIEQFHLHVYRLYILVSLLMGQIPERNIFEIPLIKANLNSVYFDITATVRSGNVEEFNKLLKQEANIKTFQDDNVYNLVLRLSPTIIRAGLIKLTKIYTTVPLTKVGKLLNIPQEDIHSVVTKAIFDGVIHAEIDESDILHVINPSELYITTAPRELLINKINYVHKLHEQCQQGKKYLDQRGDDNKADATKPNLMM